MDQTMKDNPTLKSQAYSLEEEQKNLFADLDLKHLESTPVTKETELRMNHGPSGRFNTTDFTDLNILDFQIMSPGESDLTEDMNAGTNRNLEELESNLDFDAFLAQFKDEAQDLEDQQFPETVDFDEPCFKKAHLDHESVMFVPQVEETKYRERRRKNNLASKRSRQIRKEKNMAQEEEVVKLEQHNSTLRRKVKELELENKEFREKLMVLLCKKK